MSTESVVASAAEAMGGADRIGACQTLRARITYGDHGYVVTHEVARPRQIRTTGGDRYIVVFDGERAAFLKNTDRDGNALPPSLIAEENLKDFELEIAWLFPAFFDHPAEYLGIRELDGAEVHVLRVALPLGAPLEYCLDARTFLPVRAQGSIVYEGTEYTFGRLYHDYAEVDGVLYPTRMETFMGADEPEPAIIESVELDIELVPALFAIPDKL